MSEAAIAEGGSTPAIGATTTVAPTTTTQTPVSSEAPVTAAPPTAPVDPPQPKGVAKRIDELTRNWREAQRQNERLLALLEQGRKPQAEQPKPAQPKSFKDFNYDENAYREHLYNEARAQAIEAAKSEASKWKAQQEAQQRRAKFDERAAKYAATNPEYAEVISGEWECSEPMAQAIEESEEGPAVAFYLAQNPEISSQLARLGAVQAGREIDRIERKLVEERKKAAEKPVSQAPPPPPTIDASDPGSTQANPLKMTPDQLGKLSQKDYEKWRAKQLARRR